MTEYSPEDETPPADENTPDPDAGSTEDAPEETTPKEPQVEQKQTESKGERVTRLGVDYEVSPEHGHRQVR